MYKNKYSKLKSQIGSAPTIADLPSDVLDQLDIESHVRLVLTKKAFIDQFTIYHSSYISNFAPDIIIPNNIYIYNVNCNKYIVHTKIKEILKKFKREIPADNVLIIPLLNKILLETIPNNNKKDGEFLISIGASIEIIESNSYRDQGLTEIYIPNTVRVIMNGAFANNQLTSAIIPNFVTSIFYNAFNKNKLKSVILSERLIYIGESAFANNAIENIFIPQDVELIDRMAFYNNKITNLNISDKVYSIRELALASNQLTKLYIPMNVNFIGWIAFGSNPIKDVTIQRNFENDIKNIFSKYTQINYIIMD